MILFLLVRILLRINRFCMFFSRRDDHSLDSVFDSIEEVVLAAQGLKEVSTQIKELTNLANRRTTLSLTEVEAAALRDAFACIICKGKWKFCLLQTDVCAAQLPMSKKKKDNFALSVFKKCFLNHICRTSGWAHGVIVLPQHCWLQDLHWTVAEQFYILPKMSSRGV